MRGGGGLRMSQMSGEEMTVTWSFYERTLQQSFHNFFIIQIFRLFLTIVVAFSIRL